MGWRGVAWGGMGWGGGWGGWVGESGVQRIGCGSKIGKHLKIEPRSMETRTEIRGLRVVEF